MYTDLFFIGFLLSVYLLFSSQWLLLVTVFLFCCVEKILLSWGVNNNKLVTKIFFSTRFLYFFIFTPLNRERLLFFNCLGKILISGVCLFVFVWNLLFFFFYFSDFSILPRYVVVWLLLLFL